MYFFEGQDDRVRFVSTLSDPVPDRRAPLRLVTVFAEPGRGLFVQGAPLLGGGLPEEGREAAHLLDDRVREIRLRYLSPEGWVGSWEPKEVQAAGARRGGRPGQVAEPPPAIPRAVEVTLTLAPSHVLGPITVPVFTTTELKRVNPAGGPTP